MTFIESFLPAFAANVANLMVQVAGAKTAAKFTAPETQTSIERCVHHGTTALLSKALSSSGDDLHKLTDCFSDFFEKKAVARELSKLLRGKEPDPEELVYLFEDEGGWNLEKMPPIDFDAGIRAFIAAFMASAKEDPLLNRIIRAEQLIEQTQLQRELLEEMRGLSAFLSREGHRVVGIGADKIEARNVANNIVIYEVAPVNAESKRAETEEQHYLKTLIAHCDQLDLATIDEVCGAGETIRVSDVFTTLNLQGISRDPDETVGDAILNPQRKERNLQKLNFQKGEEKEPVPVQAVEAIAALPHLVLLGQPGGGKSTVVNYLAAQLAKRRFGASTASVSIPGWKDDERPLPVRVFLRHLAKHHSDNSDNAGEGLIWSYIRKQLIDSGCEGFYGPLRQVLLDEGGIVFFDGLDEVVQTKDDPRRTRMKDAVAAFAESMDKCRIVITSREYAYLKSDAWRLPPDRFTDVTLDVFNDGQIEEFTNTWYKVIGPTKGWSETETQQQATHLVSAAQSLPHLRELAQYPLLLTLMAQVHSNIGYLPENRADLYDRAVNLLLAHWDNRLVRDVGGACTVDKGIIMRLGIRLETLRAALERVAFTAHEKQEKTEDRTDGCADIPMADLLFELETDLKSLDKAKTVVEYIHERAGLLNAQEEYRVYAFPHRTFQEYLAACHIMKKGDYHALLKERVERDLVWWREVYLLAAGHSRKFPVYVSNLVSSLLPNGPTASEKREVPAQQGRYAVLAGKALVETEFSVHVEKEGGAGIYSRAFNDVRDWLTASIPSDSTLEAGHRAEAGLVLSRLGDTRPEVVVLDEMRFCLVPGGPFQMGDGEERHLNEHIRYDYWISRHPATNAQYMEFVKAGGYADGQHWTEAVEAGLWEDGKFEDRNAPVNYGQPYNLANHPVVGVTWYEALAFTRWLTERWRKNGFLGENWLIRLPSEAEWEKAARGGLEILAQPVVIPAAGKGWDKRGEPETNKIQERRYPWGNEESKEKANYGKTGIGTTSAVGCFPSGGSPYGCLDMAGNVWEWTRSLWGKDLFDPEYVYPYEPTPEREKLSADPDIARVLRGGACGSSAANVRCASRGRDYPGPRYTYVGFRCVCAPNTSVL